MGSSPQSTNITKESNTDCWRSESQPLREAFAAGLFSRIVPRQEPLDVQLDRERFPDFNVRMADGSELAFELVEAGDVGRRRAEECRESER